MRMAPKISLPGFLYQTTKSWPLALAISGLCMFSVPFTTTAGTDIDIITAKTISTIADYSAPQADVTGRILTDLGYSPQISTSTWKQFPTVRKLETAYVAAETANPGGGEDMLTLFIHKLGDMYQSAKNDPELMKYISKTLPSDQPIKFARLSPTFTPNASLPAEAILAIKAITRYIDANALGGVHNILLRYLSVPESDVYEILRTSNTNTEALERGCAGLEKPVIVTRLYSIVTTLQYNYQSANYDDSLNKFKVYASPVECWCFDERTGEQHYIGSVPSAFCIEGSPC